MNSLCLFWTCLSITFLAISSLPVDYDQGTSVSRPKPGSPLDEVIVESSLHIKNKKSQARRTREIQELIPEVENSLRVKRQHRGRRPRPHNNDSSQSSANAAANGNYFGPDGFGASAANAQAQGFYSGGSLGGFGANGANTQTQSFSVGPDGLHASAGGSLSQVYHLPNGKTINVAFSNTLATGAEGDANGNANAITFS